MLGVQQVKGMLNEDALGKGDEKLDLSTMES